MEKLYSYYTVYDRNDEIIAFGSAHECAKTLGMTLQSFYTYVTNPKKRVNRKYIIVIEKITGEERKAM